MLLFLNIYNFVITSICSKRYGYKRIYRAFFNKVIRLIFIRQYFCTKVKKFGNKVYKKPYLITKNLSTKLIQSTFLTLLTYFYPAFLRGYNYNILTTLNYI